MNSEGAYAAKNALLYTLVVATILLTPLYIYMVYLKNMHDIHNEIELKKHATIIIKRMEEFGERGEKSFEFPRFSLVKAGLYDQNMKTIFSLIEKPINLITPGYHNENGFSYYVLQLPNERYFDATYLVTSQAISYVEIYQKVLLILLFVTLVIYLLSLLFLERFSKPFKVVNKKLDRFIKDSMHEINTPLSIINVNIDLYNRQHEANKYFQRIKAAAKSLSTIYNDMDYLIKDRKTSFHQEEISLNEFLKERIEYFTEVALMKGIIIESTITESVVILFNEVKLQRVVDNNLSNALKYSNENSIVNISLYYDGKSCKLSFKDEGVGIKDPSKIFERYYRENLEKGGFGIGLNIVKRIIDEAGITLDIESSPGNGSTFSYTFPSSMIIKTLKQ